MFHETSPSNVRGLSREALRPDRVGCCFVAWHQHAIDPSETEAAADLRSAKVLFTQVRSGLVLPTSQPDRRVPRMHHADRSCDCGAAVSALALRWRCPECGKTAIMKVSTLRSEERRVGKAGRSRRRGCR